MTPTRTSPSTRAAHLLLVSCLSLSALGVAAKLPAPSDEAKAKAAEAAAKTAHGNKVADFQLCNAQNRVAAKYQAGAKKAGHEVKAPAATPDCVDPGAFVPAPPASGAAIAGAAATAMPGASAAPAAASAPKTAASK